MLAAPSTSDALCAVSPSQHHHGPRQKSCSLLEVVLLPYLSWTVVTAPGLFMIDPWYVVAPLHLTPRINGYRQIITMYEIPLQLFQICELAVSLTGF